MRFSLKTRIILGLLGALFFGYLVHRVGPASLVESMLQLGWGWLALVLLGGINHWVKTLAWQQTFTQTHRTVSLWELFLVRISGESLAQISFGGQVVGETTRVVLLGDKLPMVVRVTSVIADRSLFTFTGLFVIATGALLAPFIISLPRNLTLVYSLIALFLLALVGLFALALRKGWPILSGPVALLARIKRFRHWSLSRRDSLLEIDLAFRDFYDRSHRAFWIAFSLNICGHAFAVLEVFLILTFLGLPATFPIAFLVEALTKLVNFAGAVIPANVGTYEGGNMLILDILDLGASNGLALGVARRSRTLSWATIGLLVLYWRGFVPSQVAMDRKFK